MSEQVKYLRTVAERLYKANDYTNSNTVDEAADFLEATLSRLDAALESIRLMKLEVQEQGGYRNEYQDFTPFFTIADAALSVVERQEPLSGRLKALGFSESGEGDTMSRKWNGPE